MPTALIRSEITRTAVSDPNTFACGANSSAPGRVSPSAQLRKDARRACRSAPYPEPTRTAPCCPDDSATNLFMIPLREATSNNPRGLQVVGRVVQTPGYG